MKGLVVRAPAKVNLFLEITGKRSDGYHTLSTLFQTISLHDVMSFSPADRLTLTCSDPSLPTDERNIVLRAAQAVRDYLKEPRGARIHLEKNIPMGAGLGGGSSDAAAVLKALPALWKRRIPLPDLHRLAIKLGADVPFFLKGGLCAATGIGERLKPLKPLPKTWIVLVYPGYGVSTKDAYAKVKLPFAAVKRLPNISKQAALTASLFNRFEEFVFPDYPELPALKRELLQAGARGALMSGSGSSVYGLFSSPAQGRRIYARLHEKYPRSWLVQSVS